MMELEETEDADETIDELDDDVVDILVWEFNRLQKMQWRQLKSTYVMEESVFISCHLSNR